MLVLSMKPELGLAERAALIALRSGWANYENSYQVIADCHGMMVLGMKERPCSSTKAACDIGAIAILNIYDRQAETGKYGATGDELAALELMINAAEDFWKRQSGRLFFSCIRKLKIIRSQQYAEGIRNLKKAA